MSQRSYEENQKLIGQKFGRLTVIGVEPNRPYERTRLICRCECGAISTPDRTKVVNGKTRSCGCLALEVRTKHGEAAKGSAEYEIWRAMKRRCTIETDAGWTNYGGRGIQVCDRWLHSFENFLEDVGRRPSKKHTLDRIENDGNYEPGNVRWATRTEQMRNCRINHPVTARGETHLLVEWEAITGISQVLISHRLADGWDPERAIFTPPKKAPMTEKLTIDGKTRTLLKWAERNGIPRATASWRLRNGWEPAEAVTVPVSTRRHSDLELQRLKGK